MAGSYGYTRPSDEGERDPFDNYPTQPEWLDELQDVWPFDPTLPVWEPAAGDGNLVHALQGYGLDVKASDVVERDVDFPVVHKDFFEFTEPLAPQTVTNPPFRHFSPWVKHSLELCDGKVAVLGAVHALGGVARTLETWLSTPPSLVLVDGRRMLVNGKKSQFHHLWFCWDKRDNRLKPGQTTQLLWTHGQQGRDYLSKGA